MTVDPKGRVSLPRGVQSFAATVQLGAGPTIKVMFGHDDTPTVPPMDGRGRLHLPQGLMRTVGMRPGDRVVVIRRADRDAFELVPAGSLRVRHGAA